MTLISNIAWPYVFPWASLNNVSLPPPPRLSSKIKFKANKFGRTPVYIAAENGKTESIKLLLEAGADKDKASDDGAPPLYIAAQNGHTESVKLLLEAGADKDKANKLLLR